MKKIILLVGIFIFVASCTANNTEQVETKPMVATKTENQSEEQIQPTPLSANTAVPASVPTSVPTVQPTSVPTVEPTSSSISKFIPDTHNIPSICKTDGAYISEEGQYLAPLIDAHVHLKIWGFSYPVESLMAIMEESGIVKVVVHDDAKTAMDAYKQYPEKIIPFTRHGSSPTKQTLVKLDKQLATQNYYGIGEVSLRHWSRRVSSDKGSGTSLEAQKRQEGGGNKGEETPGDSLVMKKMLDLAAKYNVPVAIHLDNLYTDELQGLLAHNSQGNVIWSHVGTTPLKMTDPESVIDMMDKYPNLYADLSAVSPYMKRSSLLNFDGSLKEEWAELFEKHPDRFFFGIDVFLEEHLTSIKSEVVYWRKVLGQLQPETALKIGCSNIEKLTSSKSITKTVSPPTPTQVPAIVGTVRFLVDVQQVTTSSELGQSSIVGPGLIRLSDGRYRLYLQARANSNDKNTDGINVISLISTDGIQWDVEPGIRISHGNESDVDFEAGEPEVYFGLDDKYHMAYTGRYIGVNKQGKSQKMHRVVFAVSNDGLAWTKLNQHYADPENINDFASSADVTIINGEHVIYYTGQRNIIRATYDGLTWVRQEIAFSTGHDSTMVKFGDGYYMFVMMPKELTYDDPNSDIKKDTKKDVLVMAISPDGVNWSKNYYQVLVENVDGSEVDAVDIQDPGAIVLSDESLRIFLNDFGGKSIYSIKPATTLPKLAQ